MELETTTAYIKLVLRKIDGSLMYDITHKSKTISKMIKQKEEDHQIELKDIKHLIKEDLYKSIENDIIQIL